MLLPSWLRSVGLAAFTAGLLMGCAAKPIVWRSTDEQQFKRDNYQCVQESRTSWGAGGSGAMGPALMLAAKHEAEANSRRLYIMCMEARGYTQIDRD